MPGPESEEEEVFNSPEPQPEVIDLEGEDLGDGDLDEEAAAADGVVSTEPLGTGDYPEESGVDDRPAGGGKKPRTPRYRTPLRRGQPGSAGLRRSERANKRKGLNTTPESEVALGSGRVTTSHSKKSRACLLYTSPSPRDS